MRGGRVPLAASDIDAAQVVLSSKRGPVADLALDAVHEAPIARALGLVGEGSSSDDVVDEARDRLLVAAGCRPEPGPAHDLPRMPLWSELVGMTAAELEAVAPAHGGKGGSGANRQDAAMDFSVRRRHGRYQAVNSTGTVVDLWATGADSPPVGGPHELWRLIDDPYCHLGPDQHAEFLKNCARTGTPVALLCPPAPWLVGRLPAPLVRALSDAQASAYRDTAGRDEWLERLARSAAARHDWPTVGVVSVVRDSVALNRLSALVAAQCWPSIELTVAVPEEMARKSTNDGSGVRLVRGDQSSGLRRAIEATTAETVAVMRAEDAYGVHHLEGLMEAKTASGADLVSRCWTGVYRSWSDSTAIVTGPEGRDLVEIASVLGRRAKVYALVGRMHAEPGSVGAPPESLAVRRLPGAQHLRRAMSRADEGVLDGVPYRIEPGFVGAFHAAAGGTSEYAPPRSWFEPDQVRGWSSAVI